MTASRAIKTSWHGASGDVLPRPGVGWAASIEDSIRETELLVIETHPIQYHVPVYRQVEQTFGVSVTVVYGSDFSIAGYHDKEFGSDFAWDTDLVSGYRSVFLSRSADGGAKNDREVRTSGLEMALKRFEPRAVLCVGYSPRFHWQAFTSA